MCVRHTVKPPRTAPRAKLDRRYATNVASARAVDFLRKHRGGSKPYFLEVATYGQHVQMTKGYDDPRVDNAPTYLRRNRTTRPAPAWNTNPATLHPAGALTAYRDRARMVQSIDRMLGRLRAEAGHNTYFFLTADNGFHLGELQLNGGKGTPYDFDTQVPLVVTGPGVQKGSAGSS
jgi:hypothetical protein